MAVAAVSGNLGAASARPGYRTHHLTRVCNTGSWATVITVPLLEKCPHLYVLDTRKSFERCPLVALVFLPHAPKGHKF